MIEYDHKYGDQAIDLWRSSKKEALGLEDPHDHEAYRAYLEGVLLKTYQVVLAIDQDQVLGLMVYNKMEINQLYVSVSAQGSGVGSRLISLAKKASSHLWLHVFKVNQRAVTFYENQGFRVVDSSFDNEEGLEAYKMIWNKN